jgi:hypothetical protein
LYHLSKKRKTRRTYSSEEKIRIVIDGMHGETTITGLCVKKGFLKPYLQMELRFHGGWQKETQ